MNVCARRTAAGASALIVALLAVAALTAGCGSDKPAYCDKVSDFKGALDDLKDVDVKKDGVDQVVSAAKKVKSTGQAAASAVTGDLKDEAAGVKSSLGKLGATLKQLPHQDQRKAALARVPDELDAVSAAYKKLADATDPKCK